MRNHQRIKTLQKKIEELEHQAFWALRSGHDRACDYIKFAIAELRRILKEAREDEGL